MGKEQSKMPDRIGEDEISALAEDMNLSEEEIVDSYKKFVVDYPDGTLNLTQLKGEYQKYFPDGDAGSFAEMVFRNHDINGDGIIDFREFITALSITRRGTARQKLKWMFSMYDVKNNGWITKDDMLVVVKAIYEMKGDTEDLPYDQNTPEKCVGKIFRSMDANGDGILSLREFIEGVEKHPTIEGLLNIPASKN